MAKPKRKKSWKTRFYIYLMFLILLSPVINFMWQVYKKPTEVLRPISKYFNKSPKQTWYSYYDEFNKHADPYLSAEYLAALAQVESSGNPIAQTYWDFKLSTDISKMYAPASSSVGLYQFTEPSFQIAKNICKTKNGYKFLKEAPVGSCFFHKFKTRLSASDSIELAANHLNYNIEQIMLRKKMKLNPVQIEALASVIHLCGPRAADRLVQRSFSLELMGNCGAHNVKNYHRKISRMASYFRAL